MRIIENMRLAASRTRRSTKLSHSPH